MAAVALQSPSWVEIPDDDYGIILGVSGPDIAELNALVKQYHALAKGNLQGRIQKLQEISDFLPRVQNVFASTMALLSTAIDGKREYLRQVEQIPSDEVIEQYHTDSSECGSYKPFVLRNNVTYSLKMKEHWGKFWLESIDPCHRRLANYYQFWLRGNTSPVNYQSFFIWLESQPLPRQIPYVTYLTDSELESYRVERSQITTDPTKRNLFVIDLSKNLYVVTWKEGIWHTSLSRGKPVLGAGLIHMEQGVICTIAFESGHYLLSIEENYQSIQVLKERGASFRDPLKIIYFENRNKYEVLVPVSSLDTFDHFNESIHSEQRVLISSNEF